MASFANTIAAKIQKIPTKTRLYGFGVLILVLCGLFIYLVPYPDDDPDQAAGKGH